MRDASVICERLGELGELRLYRRHGPPEHLAVEILRDEDGRAWTLRVPWSQRGPFRHLLSDSVWRLASASRPAADREGIAQLCRAVLGQGDEILSLFMESGPDRAFALWRRELLQRGDWSWTLDVVVVPDDLAVTLCNRVIVALDQLERG